MLLSGYCLPFYVTALLLFKALPLLLIISRLKPHFLFRSPYNISERVPLYIPFETRRLFAVSVLCTSYSLSAGCCFSPYNYSNFYGTFHCIKRVSQQHGSSNKALLLVHSCHLQMCTHTFNGMLSSRLQSMQVKMTFTLHVVYLSENRNINKDE